MKLILKFLTREQVNEINNRIHRKEATYQITNSLKGLNRQQKAIVNQHIRDIKYPRTSRGMLGSKTEPYQTEEQMLNAPKYSWEELPDNEKQFHAEFGKKKEIKKK